MNQQLQTKTKKKVTIFPTIESLKCVKTHSLSNWVLKTIKAVPRYLYSGFVQMNSFSFWILSQRIYIFLIAISFFMNSGQQIGIAYSHQGWLSFPFSLASSIVIFRISACLYSSHSKKVKWDSNFCISLTNFTWFQIL